jgi:tetratricopeptide (TPR) repeat protein
MLLAPLALAGGKAVDVLTYRPDADGFILDWLVSVRHPFDYAYLGATMNYDALAAEGGEAKAAPVAGMKAGRGNPWAERHFKVQGWAKGVCELRPASMHMTYAFVYLFCEEAKRDLVLLTGSDDALLVLLNGRQVQKVQMQRGYNTDQDRVGGIVLEKGWNRLLLKVDDYMGGHGFVVRFKTKDGQPVTDLKVCLSRPPAGWVVRFVDGVRYEAEAASQLKAAVRLSAEDGDLAGAEKACREVVAKFPRSRAAAEALYQAASFLRQRKEPDVALATLDDLLARYPYAKWAEDSLVAKAGILKSHRKDYPAAERALAEMLDRFDKSALVPEALLEQADLQARQERLDTADAVLAKVRDTFPNTVEATRALEAMGDNHFRRKDSGKARECWRQVVQEADTLAKGKYVWFVNVQAVLAEIAGRARAKAEGKQKPE